MNTKIKEILDDNGHVPAYAWPGGYTMFYMTKEDDVLCAVCANKELQNLAAYAANFEDTELYCAECNNQIQASYA